MINKLISDLNKLKNPKKAKILQRFFKTGRREYGEGDIFLGIVVPKQREVAKKYTNASLNDLQKLLSSKIHEYRLVALLILVQKYKSADAKALAERKAIINFYLKNTKNINNWDLVDLTAEKILGEYFLNKDRKILYKLVRSENVWERRIAILTTFQFIKSNQFEDTLRISEILLTDKHDLIHKAVGWMLREVGKRNLRVEEKFLKKYYRQMPRTMLRYAIEKFPEGKRQLFLRRPHSAKNLH
jgi:3-methyladenine DNA glycosylase AlkD